MTLSVWMITYNQEDYIAQALDSVLSQKVNFDFEIVIGEDCSTDNTRAILLAYKKNYPAKIKLLLHKRNQGMVKNQNLTFEACKGKYIAMLEGDDFWNNPNKLQVQYEAMLLHEDCDISFHTVNTSKNATLNQYGSNIKVFSTQEVIRGGGYFISTPSIMIKKSVITQMPKFLENAPAGDYYLQILGSLKGGALFIPKNMATYRVNAKSSWTSTLDNIKIDTSFKEATLQTIRILDKYLEYKYTNAFQDRYMYLASLLSMSYIQNKLNEKFIKTMEETQIYVLNKNFKYKLSYILRKHPKILLTLSETFKMNLITYRLSINSLEARILSIEQYINDTKNNQIKKDIVENAIKHDLKIYINNAYKYNLKDLHKLYKLYASFIKKYEIYIKNMKFKKNYKIIKNIHNRYTTIYEFLIISYQKNNLSLKNNDYTFLIVKILLRLERIHIKIQKIKIIT
ncbi:MAG TPA: glycosyltransferase [Arcobacter sp.]|nr:glycosyltransferase [Arcobacter sp.]